MTSPVGLHRVVQPAGVLPQAAWRLDASAAIAPNEVRIRVQRLNLDAASFRQLSEKHGGDGTRCAPRYWRSFRRGGRCRTR
ncbi:hypothetical protein GCM10027614_08080 [Micromonospora vulcania]